MHGLRARAGVFAVASALFAGCTGCTVGPDYRPPEPPLPETWRAGISTPAADPRIDEAWWAAFDDPLLTQLVERALIANNNLARAEAAIAEARALRTQAASAFYPSIDGGSSVTRSRQTTRANTTGLGGLNVGADDRSSINTFYEAGFDATWEIDLFGGIRRSVEAADAFVGAQTEAANDVRLTLAGDVARAYVDARGLQRRIEVTQQTIDAQRDTVDLTSARFQAGTGTGLDAVRAEAQLATFAAALPPLQTALAEDIHRLGVLTGQPPEALADALSVPQPIPVAETVPGQGLPADLLRRRPDVRTAERLLAEATANIGVAVADRYPSLTLPESITLDNTKLLDLFQSASLIWSVGPQVTVPLFDAGFRRAEVQARIARQQQARADYQQTVLGSLEEVENALVAYAQEAERRRALRQSAASNTDAVMLATELYTRGLGTFLDVLDAQRSLFQAQSDLAASEAALSVDLVALYKALGGGWAVEPAALSATRAGS
jgi:outer membrane protein, multidrug efflux system